jgi:RNA polymerase sigma-70 factor (ECF subfamily)
VSTDQAISSEEGCEPVVNKTSRIGLEERFRSLLAANGPALSRLAGSYTRSTSDRDDLLQEIAMAIWKALPSFRGESSERTFIFRVAHNRALTHLAQRRPSAELDEANEVSDPRPNPERGFSEGQQQARLLNAIHRLPIGYRQVITLALEEMSYDEIAEVLGISESNVGARLSRARQLLREMLEVRK